ncbi:MAG: glutamate synthase subunit beta [Alphaproteobacteria bacterium]|nr:glutamate synthase subunit beta [Alphaproteobacteria bacterium]
MGKVTGFLEVDRHDRTYEPASDRVRNFQEFVIPLPEREVVSQASRCMDCGIPYCHSGCPVNNQIPDWNDLVYHEDWEEAARNLHSTNNFPEFTGRVCPAPCEASCTLNIEDIPVTIKTIECAIVDNAFDNGWVRPEPARTATGKSVAIVGSGPAGLAAAQQLARVGHKVTVYEKASRPGGLLRYGIPNYKLEKRYVDRRLAQLEAEGVTFVCNTTIGKDITAADLARAHDAVLLTGGAEKPRDLPVEGRELDGIHFAMDFLAQQNRRFDHDSLVGERLIHANFKHVVVIGGGDTGSDCIGTSIRQGALSVTQLEIMPKPPEKENKLTTWPEWPQKLRISSSQQEGADSHYAVTTTRFAGENGKVKKLHCAKVGPDLKPIAGSEFILDADLVLLAMGFVSPVHEGMLDALGLARDKRGNVLANTEDYRTSMDRVYAAGDMRRGQSLVVWAIREGRQAARSIDLDLMGATTLPR